MNIHIRRTTSNGDHICFNHAILAAINGVPLIEEITSDTSGYCKWCTHGVPMKVKSVAGWERIGAGT